MSRCKLDIYLRGGHKIELSVTDWKLKKSALEGRLTELSWTMADAKKLPFIALEEVVAVVERP